jgi:hypothetical protein
LGVKVVDAIMAADSLAVQEKDRFRARLERLFSAAIAEN